MYISIRAVAHSLLLITFAYFEARIGVYRLYFYSLSIFSLFSTLSFPFINLLARTPGVHPLWINSALGVYFIVASGFYVLTTG
jgi:hypothetical protein